MRIDHAPSGKMIIGHVLDVKKEPLERALRDYDPLLYLKWSPKKLHNWGCWEIRRRPAMKTIVDTVQHANANYLVLGYREVDLVHHVLDVPFLNYDVLTKLAKMDTWSYGATRWVNDLDYNQAKYEERQVSKARAELAAMARDIKPMISDLREKILSGWNPAQIASYWDK